MLRVEAFATKAGYDLATPLQQWTQERYRTLIDQLC